MLVFSALWALLLGQLLTSTLGQVRFTHSRAEAPAPLVTVAPLGRACMYHCEWLPKPSHALSLAGFTVARRCRVCRTFPRSRVVFFLRAVECRDGD